MTADDTTPDRAAIRARAETALDTEGHEPWYEPGEVHDLSNEQVRIEDSEFIAGMDPATTIALLDALDLLLLDRASAEDDAEEQRQERTAAEVEVRRLRDAITTLADQWDATTERVTGVAAEHWRGRDFAEGVNLRTETLVDDLRALLDGGSTEGGQP